MTNITKLLSKIYAIQTMILQLIQTFPVCSIQDEIILITLNETNHGYNYIIIIFYNGFSDTPSLTIKQYRNIVNKSCIVKSYTSIFYTVHTYYWYKLRWKSKLKNDGSIDSVLTAMRCSIYYCCNYDELSICYCNLEDTDECTGKN